VVKLNQKVTVTVTEVDVNRKRIALTMKDKQAAANEPRQAAPKSFNKPLKQNQSSAPLNPFQKSLADLKKKFDN